MLLLCIGLYSRVHWIIKAVAILVTSLFYVVTWLSLPPMMGWPTHQDPPQQFRLVATHVLQPDKATDTEGLIYLWLQGVENMQISTPPRSYALPYSNALHERIIGVDAKLAQGIAQLGEFREPEKKMQEINKQPRSSQVSVDIEFYDIPDPLFPEKQ